MPRNATPPPWRRCRRHRRPTSSVCSSASDFTVGSGPHAGKRSRTPRTTASFFLRGLFLATWSVQRYRQAASPSLLDGRWHGCEYMDGTCARKACLPACTAPRGPLCAVSQQRAGFSFRVYSAPPSAAALRAAATEYV